MMPLNSSFRKRKIPSKNAPFIVSSVSGAEKIEPIASAPFFPATPATQLSNIPLTSPATNVAMTAPHANAQPSSHHGSGSTRSSHSTNATNTGTGNIAATALTTNAPNPISDISPSISRSPDSEQKQT